ncbi:MAG: small basic protein [Pirellulaceae bacterium]
MTIDRSLRVRKGMLSNRNVLKRAERLEKLKETERWQEGDSVFGLPKVKIQKVALKRKKKVKDLEETDEAATEATPEETET